MCVGWAFRPWAHPSHRCFKQLEFQVCGKPLCPTFGPCYIQNFIFTECWCPREKGYHLMVSRGEVTYKRNTLQYCVTPNYFLWGVMHYILFALLFVTWAGKLIYFYKSPKQKAPKLYFFGKCKSPFTPKMKLISLRQESASAFKLILNLSQHGTGELSVNKREKVNCNTYLKSNSNKSKLVNSILLRYFTSDSKK